MSWQTHAPVHFCTCICRLKRSYQQICRSLPFRSKLIHLPPTKLTDELGGIASCQASFADETFSINIIILFVLNYSNVSPASCDFLKA